MDWAGNYSQAGKACRTETAGLWWAAMDESDWPEDQEQRQEIAELWQCHGVIATRNRSHRSKY